MDLSLRWGCDTSDTGHSRVELEVLSADVAGEYWCCLRETLVTDVFLQFLSAHMHTPFFGVMLNCFFVGLLYNMSGIGHITI